MKSNRPSCVFIDADRYVGLGQEQKGAGGGAPDPFPLKVSAHRRADQTHVIQELDTRDITKALSLQSPQKNTSCVLFIEFFH